MGRLAALKAMVREGRIGFLVDEVMTGTHSFEPSFGSPEQRPMEFRVTWGAKHLPQRASPTNDRFMVYDLEGSVTIDGLCFRKPCRGSLALRYFKDHTIRYTFWFEVDGRPYKYLGEKRNIHLWNLPRSHTTCFGRLILEETGEVVSTSVTRFRMRSLPGFMASIRLA